MLPVLLPLLLLQLMVATLLALQVEFGVLELGCQLLAFLLQLLRHPLHLLIVCLHVCQLTHTHTHKMFRAFTDSLPSVSLLFG